jgi:hypothetical protein
MTPRGSVDLVERHARLDQRFANFTVDDYKTANLKRHQDASGHKIAVSSLLKLQDEVCGAPSTADFAAVWKALRSGNSCRSGLPGVANYNKARTMLWCIFEAVNDLDRDFLTKGDVVTILHRDERKGKLQVRFSAANASLRARQGVLGVRENEGGGKEIAQATEQIVKTFFTPRAPIASTPYSAKEIRATKVEQMTKFLNSVEMVNVDSAEDERIACMEGQKTFTPNAKLIARDKAHGARRHRFVYTHCLYPLTSLTSLIPPENSGCPALEIQRVSKSAHVCFTDPPDSRAEFATLWLGARFHCPLTKLMHCSRPAFCGEFRVQENMRVWTVALNVNLWNPKLPQKYSVWIFDVVAENPPLAPAIPTTK